MKAGRQILIAQIWEKAIFQILRRLYRYKPKPQDDLALMRKYFHSQTVAPRVLFLGDSVAERVSLYDRDRRSLAMMVQSDLAGEFEVACITHSAYHMKIYYYMLATLQKMDHRPDLVVLPVNLRSFSPQWDLEPSWQFADEIQALKNFAGFNQGEEVDPGIPPNEYGTEEKYEHFDALAVDYPLSPFKRIGEFRLLIGAKPGTKVQADFRMQQIFVFHYLHPLLSVHPKVTFLKRIIALLKDMDISLLAYVTPVNYQGGERYLGEQFTTRLRANVKGIQDCFLPYSDVKNLCFLDLSEFLTSDYFFRLDEPTEHLNVQGRARLSQAIADNARQMIVSTKEERVL